MKVEVGDLFAPARLIAADAIGITTCAVIRADKTAVMGAGLAKEAAMRWGELPRVLAQRLRATGMNHVHYLGNYKANPRHQGESRIDVFSFPTKHHWKNPSDLELIKRSARQLMEMTDKHGWKDVILGAPGVGLGGLNWNRQVEPAIRDLLDDRITIVFLKR